MLYEIYNLGTNLEYVKRGVRLGWRLFPEDMVYDNFIRVQEGIKYLGFKGEINKRVKNILEYFEKNREEEEETFSGSTKSFVLNDIEAIKGLLQNELNRMLIFEAVKECALDKDCLIKLSNKEKSVMFDDRVWDRLSDIAKSDHSDSAKCILMGAATPAAMISLRAAEEEVRKYYTSKTGNNPGKKAWGTLIAELKREPEYKEELLDHLDYVRKTRRNFAQHPEKIFNQREAERIFMDVISLVHDIHDDI